SSQTTVGVLGSHAVAMTGATSGAIAAIVGNDSVSGRATIVPVTADRTLGTAVDDGVGHSRSSLVNVGNALALVNWSTANNCSVDTVDLAVTAHAGATGWGTNGLCMQPIL